VKSAGPNIRPWLRPPKKSVLIPCGLATTSYIGATDDPNVGPGKPGPCSQPWPRSPTRSTSDRSFHASGFTHLHCSPKWPPELTRSAAGDSFLELELAGTNPNLMHSEFLSINVARDSRKHSRYCGLCALVNDAHLLANSTLSMMQYFYPRPIARFRS